MGIRFIQFLCLLTAAFSISCTQAVPEISSLGSVIFMSGKSPSPFEQENPGQYLTFSGQCIGLVKKFEFRLDSHPWAEISNSMPSPGSGESAPAPNIYDVDCSDGEFEFYVFMNQINSYITANGYSPANYDPLTVEIRGLTDTNFVVPGTLSFHRAPAIGLRLRPSDYSNSAPWWMSLLETNQMIRFRIALIDSNGQETRRFSSETDLTVNVSTALVSGSSSATGEAYPFNGTNCVLTPQTNFIFTAGSGEEEIEICFNANSVTAGATIRVLVTAPGFPTQEKDFTIISQDQAFSTLIAGNSYLQTIPRTLIRGASYKFKSDLSAVNSNNGRHVMGFDGTQRVNANSTFVDFAKGRTGIECGVAGLKNSVIECIANGMKVMPFQMNVNASYPSNSLSLAINATPLASCPNCRISTPPSVYVAISGYQPATQQFNVVSGSTQYAQPRFEFSDRLSDAYCQRISLSLANSDGNTIPARSSATDNAPMLAVSTSAPGVHFYQDSNCTALAHTNGPDGPMTKIIPAPNGQFYLLGDFYNYNGISRRQIALINEDGSLDMDFNPTYYGSLIHDILPLGDGRILIGGSFTGGLRLLTETGQEDYSSFNIQVNGPVYSFAKVSVNATTDHIYIGGAFSELIAIPTNVPRNRLLKLTKSLNPTLDMDVFTIENETLPVTSSAIYQLLVDGNYLYFSGSFTTPVADLSRMNLSTWLQDLSWPSDNSGLNGDIFSLAIDQVNSRILIGGSFSTAYGQVRNNFAAVSTTTGSLINYSVNPSFNGTVSHIKVSGNTAYFAGSYTITNASSAHQRLTKFTMTSPDLNLDSSWMPTSNGTSIGAIQVTNSGLLVGGDFTTFNGELATYLTKISALALNDLYFNNDATDSTSISFNRFDLIKPVFIRNDGGFEGTVPILINDGAQVFNFNIQTEN